MAGKLPYMKFFVADWLSDPDLRSCSVTTRGIWMDFICFMWMDGRRGKLSGTVDSLAKMVNVSTQQMIESLTELRETKTARVTKCNGGCTQKVRVCNRRMQREWKSLEASRERIRRHRQKRNANVTPGNTLRASASASDYVVSSSNKEKSLPPRARESAVRDALIDMQAGADGSRVLEAVEPPGGFHFRVNFLDHYPKFSHGRDNVQAAERLYAELDVAQQAACEAAVKAFGDCAARWPPGARRYLQSPGKWLETEREHGFVIRKQDWDLPAKGNGKVLDEKVQEKYVGEDSRY